MGGCREQSVAGAAGPWGHICVLCSLSGNILIWSLWFYKTGQDLFYPWAICVSACTETAAVMQERRSSMCFQTVVKTRIQSGFVCIRSHAHNSGRSVLPRRLKNDTVSYKRNPAWLVVIAIYCMFILRELKKFLGMQPAPENDSIFFFSVVEKPCSPQWNVLFSVSTCLKLQVICSAKANDHNRILNFVPQYHSMCSFSIKKEKWHNAFKWFHAALITWFLTEL